MLLFSSCVEATGFGGRGLMLPGGQRCYLRCYPRCYLRVTTVNFCLLGTTENPADLQPGKVSMDYGKLRSPWKRLVCCPSQCQIRTREENASLSRSRLPVNGNRMERGQRGRRQVWARLRTAFAQICKKFPSDLEFYFVATLPSSISSHADI